MRNSADSPYISSYPVIRHAELPRPQTVEQDHSEPREFYDPANIHADSSEASILQVVIEQSSPKIIPGIGPAEPSEVVVAEAAHALLDGMDNIPLPISDKRRQEVLDGTQRHARRIAATVLEVADTFIDSVGRDEHSEFMRTLPPHIVVSGKVMAAVAYDNMVRRTGRAYYVHPDEASSILTIAWRKQGLRISNSFNEPDEQTAQLDLSRFLIYCHDAFEDTIDRERNYLSDPVIMTPLVAKYVLEAEGIKDPREYARVLLALTRTRDNKGNRMPYNEALIPRGLRMSGKQFILTKAPDMSHNLKIEPDAIVPGDAKSQAKFRKRRQYEDGAVQLLKAAEYYPDIAMVVHSVFQVTKAEVENEARAKYPINLKFITKAVRQRVARHEK